MKKEITVLGITTTERKMINSIIRVYKEAEGTEGKGWYLEANVLAKNLAQISGYSVEQTAGVIAALSPIKAWSENKKLAKKVCFGDLSGHTKRNLDKAKRILQGEPIIPALKGQKVVSFYKNIIDPKQKRFDAVTIDRHAICIVFNKRLGAKATVTPKQYKIIEQAYKKAALKLNVLPCELQAITWEQWRKKHGVTW